MSLSDKRKEILDNLLDMTKNSSKKDEWDTVFRETFSIIEQQDKEFIKDLKEESICKDCSVGYSRGCDCDDQVFLLDVRTIDREVGDDLI